MPIVAPLNNLSRFIGEPLEPSPWLAMTQTRINQFADATDDHQFIHIDKEKAEQTELGGTIAHGLLTLSLLPKLVEQCMVVPEGTTMGINYGFDKVRFLNPVKPDDEVRLKATVVDVQIKSSDQEGEQRVVIKLAVTIEIKGKSKPALVADWLNMFVC